MSPLSVLLRLVGIVVAVFWIGAYTFHQFHDKWWGFPLCLTLSVISSVVIFFIGNRSIHHD